MTDYLLGHHQTEWERLAAQHQLWRDGLLGVLRKHGLSSESRVLDVGCGSGALLTDLVTEAKSVVGLERDAAAASMVRERLGVHVIEGDALEVDLGGPYDLIVSRWVFSFLSDPGALVGRLLGVLSPGGRLVIQDYNHEGIGVWPEDPAIHRIFEAYREAYTQAGGDLWIAARLPQLLAARGLPVHDVVPEVKAGDVQSEVWRWVETFAFGHLDSLGEVCSPEEIEAFRTAWTTARETPGAMLFSPMVVSVVTGAAL